MGLEDVLKLSKKSGIPDLGVIRKAARARQGLFDFARSEQARYEAAVVEATRRIERAKSGNLREQGITAEVLRLVVDYGTYPSAMQPEILQAVRGRPDQPDLLERGLTSAHLVEQVDDATFEGGIVPKILKLAQTADVYKRLPGYQVVPERRRRTKPERFELTEKGKIVAAANLQRLLLKGSFALHIDGMFSSGLQETQRAQELGLPRGIYLGPSFGEMSYPTQKALPGFAAMKEVLGDMYGETLHGGLIFEEESSWREWRGQQETANENYPLAFTRFDDLLIPETQEAIIEESDLIRVDHLKRYRFVSIGIRQDRVADREVLFENAGFTFGPERPGAYRRIVIGLGDCDELYGNPRSKRSKWYFMLQQIVEEDPTFLLDVMHATFPDAFFLKRTGRDIYVENKKRSDSIEVSIPDYGIEGEVRKGNPQTSQEMYETGKKLRKENPVAGAYGFRQAVESGELKRGERRWALYYLAKCYEDTNRPEQAVQAAQASLQVPGSAKSDKYCTNLLKRLEK